jgi:hypothetical protein
VRALSADADAFGAVAAAQLQAAARQQHAALHAAQERAAAAEAAAAAACAERDVLTRNISTLFRVRSARLC